MGFALDLSSCVSLLNFCNNSCLIWKTWSVNWIHFWRLVPFFSLWAWAVASTSGHTLLLIPYCYWQEIFSTLLSSAWGPGSRQCCSLVTTTCPTGSIFECFWFLDSEPQILQAYFYSVLSLWRQSSLPLIFIFFPFWTEDSVHGPYPSVLTCIFLLQRYFKEPAPDHLVFYSTWTVVSSLPFSSIYHSKVTWLKEALKRKIWLCLYLANVLIRQWCIMQSNSKETNTNKVLVQERRIIVKYYY